MPARSLSPRAARLVLALRAVVTGAAALTVTFVQNRTGEFSLLSFQAFAVVIAAVLILAAFASGGRERAGWGALAAIHLLAALAPFTGWGTDADARFHAVLLGWAAVAGLAELIIGIRGRGTPTAREHTVVGVLTLLLALLTLLVSPHYALDYFIEEAGQTFTLTGTIIGVGLFGGWGAIVAVYLGIGAASPAPVVSEKDAS